MYYLVPANSTSYDLSSVQCWAMDSDLALHAADCGMVQLENGNFADRDGEEWVIFEKKETKAADDENTRRTEQVREMLARFPQDKPLGKVSIRFYEGRATGHGRLSAGDAISGGRVSLEGFVPQNIRWIERREKPEGALISRWVERIVDGENQTAPIVWFSHVGGWMEIATN